MSYIDHVDVLRTYKISTHTKYTKQVSIQEIIESIIRSKTMLFKCINTYLFGNMRNEAAEWKKIIQEFVLSDIEIYPAFMVGIFHEPAEMALVKNVKNIGRRTNQHNHNKKWRFNKYLWGS